MQDEKANMKGEISNWKKEFRRLNSDRDPSVEESAAILPFVQSYSELKDALQQQKYDNIQLSKSLINMQSKLYSIDMMIEENAQEFLNAFGENEV